MPPIVGLDHGVMEHQSLDRKRKVSSSPTSTSKLPKLSRTWSTSSAKTSEEREPTAEAVTSLQGTCTVCIDDVMQSQLVHLACGHDYCVECAVRLFNSAMKDESRFPPQCCGVTIPLHPVEHVLPSNFPGTFHQREIELSAPSPDRLYCSCSTCSAFIDTATVNIEKDKVVCPKCQTRTCTICKGAAHEDSDCPQDPAMISLMAMAAAEGYKQCPSCHRLVDLTFGCNHMT